MSLLMDVVDVEQGTQEWLEWRKSGVTATCAPILIGADGALKTPYELYLNYVGLLAADDLSYIKQVRAGKVLEPLARSYAERIHGQISLPLCVRHPQHHHIISSLDGVFDDDSLLEIKNISTEKHLDLLRLGVKSPDFAYYYWQCQHQLLTTGSPGVHLLFWSAKDQPKEFFIKPDLRVHRKLLQLSTEFFDCVRNRTAPPFDYAKDVLLISDAEILRQTKGFKVPENLATHVTRLYKTVSGLEAAKAEVARLEALSKAQAAGLADALGFGPSDTVRFDGFGVRYLETEIKGSINWKSLANKLLHDIDVTEHQDCYNASKKSTKITTYEYIQTQSDIISLEPMTESELHSGESGERNVVLF